METATWAVDDLGGAGAEQVWAVREIERAAAEPSSDIDTPLVRRAASAWARLAMIAAQRGAPREAANAIDRCGRLLDRARGQGWYKEIDGFVALTNTADLLQNRSETTDALVARRVALKALGPQAHLHEDDAYAERVFSALDDIARTYSEKVDIGNEIQALMDLVSLCSERKLKTEKQAWPQLAARLDHLSILLKKANRLDEALLRAEQAVNAYEQQYLANPDQTRTSYAGGINNFSNRLWEAGRRDESLRMIEKALEVLEPVVETEDPLLLGTVFGSYIERSDALGREPSSIFNELFHRYIHRSKRGQSTNA